MEIRDFTEKDLEIHNRTSAILPDEPEDPEIDLTTVEQKEANEALDDRYMYAEVYHLLNNTSFVFKNFLTEKQKMTFIRDSYVNLKNFFNVELEQKLSSLEHRVSSVPKVSNLKEKILEQEKDIKQLVDENGALHFANNGNKIKLRKITEENHKLGESLKYWQEAKDSKLHKLEESNKLLHRKIIEKDKLLKKSFRLIEIKNKVIINLATRLTGVK